MIMRSNQGVLEGMRLVNDGAYFARIDTPAQHEDIIGEFYGTPWSGGSNTTHQIGIMCANGTTGGHSAILLVDSDPVYPLIGIGSYVEKPMKLTTLGRFKMTSQAGAN
jgi:hypothetical protein